MVEGRTDTTRVKRGRAAPKPAGHGVHAWGPLRASAARAFTAGLLLAAGLLALSGLNAVSSAAVTLPAVTTPSVSVPSVTVPSVSTPVGRTPSVSTSTLSPTPPSVHTPAVSTPPAPTAALAGARSLAPSTSGTPLPAAGSQTGSGQSAPASAGAGGSTAGGSTGLPRSAGSVSARRGAGRSAIERRAARRRELHLRALVTRFSGCLSQISPPAEHLLLLRAGIGVPRPYSGAQVARLLGLTPGREARAEQQAVSALQGAARSGGCANGSAVAIGVPARDRLAWNPALAAAAPSSSASAAAAGAPIPSAGSRPGARAVSAAHARRPAAHRTILEDAVHLSTSSPARWFVLAGFALLASLAVLSAMGRRIAAREPLAAAGAPVAAAGAPVAAAGAPMTAAGAPVMAAGAPATVRPTVIPAPAPPPVAAPAVAPGPPAAHSAPAPPRAPATPPPAIAGAPGRTWLQGHRRHVAVGLTALAGGAARLLARRRR